MALAMPQIPAAEPVLPESAPEKAPGTNIILSEFAARNSLAIRDIEKYVKRGTAQRLLEKGDKDGGRPQNAFVLYRTIYQHIVGQACNELKQNNISKVVGASWNLETTAIKQKFRAMADVEKVEHAIAFGVKKYNPKKKKVLDGGRKSLAEQRTSSSRRARSGKASAAEDAHRHLRAPPRSPEPKYYQIEGTPSAEVPSLSSYQGTPMTSAVATPQPGYAQPYYAQPLDNAFDQACFTQPPYGRAQLGGQMLWNPVTRETFFAGSPPMQNTMYPDLPDSIAYVNPGAYHQYPVQMPQQGLSHMPVMTTVQQPQPVLRQIVPDTDGVMDPRALQAPVVDPVLFGEPEPAPSDAMPQMGAEVQDDFPFGQIVNNEFDYLQCDDWAEEQF